MRDDLESHLKDRSFRSDQWLIIIRFLSKTTQDSTNVVRKSCQECSSVRIWKRDILVADIEELEKLDASQIHARRHNAKEIPTSKIV